MTSGVDQTSMILCDHGGQPVRKPKEFNLLIKMLSFFSHFILLCSLIRSTYSVGLGLTVRGDLTFLKTSAGPAIIDELGGVDQFKLEVEEAVAYASSLRNNIPARWVGYLAGGGGLTAKICFADGICWADKMFAGFRHVQSASYGEGIMRLVHEYCPSIPLPESKAWFRTRLAHHITEWVEGKSLHDRVFEVGSNYSNGTSFGIPRKVARSLAEFVYNLTNCPIPRDKSKSPTQ